MSAASREVPSGTKARARPKFDVQLLSTLYHTVGHGELKDGVGFGSCNGLC